MRRRLAYPSPTPQEKAELARRRQEAEEEEEMIRDYKERVESGKTLSKEKWKPHEDTSTPPDIRQRRRQQPPRPPRPFSEYREEVLADSKRREEPNEQLLAEQKEKEQKRMAEWKRLKQQCIGCAQRAQWACSGCREEFYCSKECQQSNKQCGC